MGRRIKELERLYGIEHGGDRKSSPNNSVLISQEQLAAQLDISVDTLQNYKMMANIIPELEELLDTGIVTKTTALAIIFHRNKGLLLSKDLRRKFRSRQNIICQ